MGRPGLVDPPPMHKYLPTLLILLAAGAGYWLFAGQEDGSSEDYDLGIESEFEGEGEGEGTAERALEATGLQTTGRRAPPPRKTAAYVDPRSLPKGHLLVHPVGPDLEPFDGKDLRVHLTSTRGGRHSRLGKHGTWDPDKHLWLFKDILAGPIQIHIFGDHVVDTWADVRVRATRDNDVTVHLERAGAIRYEVILYDKTRPKTIELTLFDFEKKPIEAWFQSRSSRFMSSPVLSKKATLAPEGVVYGLAPGRYRLHALSVNAEWDDAEVDVQAGQTHVVKFEIRR